MSELKGWHVLVAMLAFFGVTIAVNVAMATYAITTFSGEDTSDPYMKGLAFNKAIAAQAAQARLGWRASIAARRGTGGDTVIEVEMHDRDGNAKDGLKLEVTLRRPIDAHLDRTVAMSATGDGHYTATVGALVPGQWDVIASAKADDGTPFQAMRRVVLQ
jgi:nitrogen fixation protein FixH